MTRRSHLHAVSRRSTFFVETRATDLPLDEQSGVRALPKASLPLPHPAALGSTGIRMLLSPVDQVRTRTRFVPELRLEQSEYQVPSEASMRLLLERAQRKARIKQAAAEASLRLEKLLREQEETYREDMIWRAKLREAKQRLEQEAENARRQMVQAVPGSAAGRPYATPFVVGWNGLSCAAGPFFQLPWSCTCKLNQRFKTQLTY